MPAQDAHAIHPGNGINLYYRNGGSWTKAQKGPFANGDGTGRILTSWPVLTSGTILLVR